MAFRRFMGQSYQSGPARETIAAFVRDREEGAADAGDMNMAIELCACLV